DRGTGDRDGIARGRTGQPGGGGGAGRGRAPAPCRGPLPRRTGSRAGAGVNLMRHPLPVTSSVTPQAAGRTPRRLPARLRHSAGLRAYGTTSGGGGSEELTGGRHARR